MKKTRSIFRKAKIIGKVIEPQLHQSIWKLPYATFKTVMVEGDLSLLIIQGKPDAQTLQEAWDTIMTEYIAALSPEGSSEKVELYKEHWWLTRLIESVNQRLELLDKLLFYKAWADEVNEKLSSNIVFNPHDREAYGKAIQTARSRLKEFENQLELVTTSIETMQQAESEEADQDVQPSYQHFLTIEHNVEGMVKYQINWDQISLGAACDWFTRYNEYRKYLESKNRKHERS